MSSVDIGKSVTSQNYQNIPAPSTRRSLVVQLRDLDPITVISLVRSLLDHYTYLVATIKGIPSTTSLPKRDYTRRNIFLSFEIIRIFAETYFARINLYLCVSIFIPSLPFFSTFVHKSSPPLA